MASGKALGSAAMGAAGEPPPGKERVMRVLRRAAVLILLGLNLGTPWAGATPPRSAAQSHPSRRATAQHVLDYLSGLLTSFWLQGGCTIDPDGRCAPGTQLLNADEGCTLDPNGRCAPGTQTRNLDAACGMDPL